MHILAGNGDVPHQEWGCYSLGMHILTGNAYPHRECTSSPGMHTVCTGCCCAHELQCGVWDQMSSVLGCRAKNAVTGSRVILGVSVKRITNQRDPLTLLIPNYFELTHYTKGGIRTKSPWTKPPRTKSPGQNPPDKIPLGQNPPGQNPPGQNPPSIFYIYLQYYILITVVSE